MDKRKSSPGLGTKLPRDYLDLVVKVFHENFSTSLLARKAKKESFVAFGRLFADELVLIVSLKHLEGIRLTTCYASVDYPPPAIKTQPTPASSSSDHVTQCVNQCVDAVASFFHTYFEEGRPVDYDLEYRQNWTVVELDKTTKVYLKINHDNLELEEQADALLEIADAKESKKKKSSLH